MLGLTIKSITQTNQLQVTIPDELKGIELQIIILPASQGGEEIEFFTADELSQLNAAQHGHLLEDNEDYSKW